MKNNNLSTYFIIVIKQVPRTVDKSKILLSDEDHLIKHSHTV